MKYSLSLVAAFAAMSLAGPITTREENPASPAGKDKLLTEENLCGPFKDNREACIQATRKCLEEKTTDEITINCVHAAAEGKKLLTEENLCGPFNGNREACIQATRKCLQDKTTDEITVKCVYAAAPQAQGPAENTAACPAAREADPSSIITFED